MPIRWVNLFAIDVSFGAWMEVYTKHPFYIKNTKIYKINYGCNVLKGKKFMIKKISKVILLFLVAICGFGLFCGINGSKSVYAEQAPSAESFFSISKQTATWKVAGSTWEYEEIENQPLIKDGDAVFLSSGEALNITLNDESGNYEISNVTYNLQYNNGERLLENSQGGDIKDYGFNLKIAQDEVAFELILNPKKNDSEDVENFMYGKYSFSFTFVCRQGDVPVQLEYEYEFYLLRSDNYRDNIKIINSSEKDEKIYNNYSSELMYLSYNYKYFNIEVNRLYKGLTTITTITNDGTNLQINSVDELGQATTNHNVKIVDKGDNVVNIVFSNLGDYLLTYTPINIGKGIVETITSFYNTSFTTSQTLYVVGAQSYITVQNGIKEFKHVKQDAPWTIENMSHSADVTSEVGDDLESFLIDVAKSGTIARTNQAPISFDTNATIKTENCYYYYFSGASKFVEDSIKKIEAGTDADGYYKKGGYDASPLAKTGIYLVCLTYSHTKIGGELTQYFLFEITSDAPEIEIYTMDGDGDKEADVYNNQYTYRSVKITKSESGIFDAESVVTVYKDTTFTGANYDAGQIVETGEDGLNLVESAKYKVQLAYGNSAKKGFTVYFVIDKNPIKNIEFKNAVHEFGLGYTVQDQINPNLLYTNNNVVLSWEPKNSGAKVTAEYKFIPMVYDTNRGASAEALYTEALGKKFGIESSYKFASFTGSLPIAYYENTWGESEVLQEQTLSASGLYMFYIYDNTGAKGKFFYVLIDKTPANVLVDDYSLAPLDEVTTQNAKAIKFGKYKLIQFKTYNGDAWLEGFLNANNTATYSSYKYLIVENNHDIYYEEKSVARPKFTVGTSPTRISDYISATADYGITLNFSAIGNDSQFKFYAISTLTKTYSSNPTGSFEYYKENSTITYSITYTTDNSQMRVAYASQNGEGLSLCGVFGSDALGTKSTYYQPATINSLNTKGQILNLSYCVDPEDDLKVESIVLKYYAFVEDVANKNYCFDLSNETMRLTIYDKASVNLGTVSGINDDIFNYQINLEYDGNSSRTKAGRYEIIRTYTDDSTLKTGDPKERVLVFIVDRNGLITEPQSVGGEDARSFVGGGIQIQVLGDETTYYDESPNVLHFYDIYYATKLNQNSPVLTTNFLPVMVYIPTYKYGYIYKGPTGNPIFKAEETICEYTEGQRFSDYELSAVVTHYETTLGSSKKQEFRFDKITGGNFLTSLTDGTITKFTEPGLYKVDIKSGGGEEFSFVFKIELEKPRFSLLNTKGTELGTDSADVTAGAGKYYTNQRELLIQWEDSPSEFLATINRNKISYKIKNGASGTFGSEIQITEDGNKRYAKINLDDIGAYYNGREIEFTLQFVGDGGEYGNIENFSTTKTLHVDLEAPTHNVNNLINMLIGEDIASNDLREIGTSASGMAYNTSATSGLFKCFAFNIYKNNLTDLIKPYRETSNSGNAYDYRKIYYKVFNTGGNNTKYIAGIGEETDITQTELSGFTDTIFVGNDNLSELEQYANNYIEIIEEDYAGNRTVYTIYLCDDADYLSREAMLYTSRTNSSAEAKDNEKSLEYEGIQAEHSLYSKYSFDIKEYNSFYNAGIDDLTWEIIKVKGQIYVKNPYSEGAYYKYGAYKDGLSNNVRYTLQELTRLDASENLQTITIFNAPKFNQIRLNVYVLNKVLEFETLAVAEGSQENELEGILIKLPTETSGNVIYGASLNIKPSGGLPSIKIEEEYLKSQQENLPTISQWSLSYVTYKGTKYLRVEINKANILPNDYFIYTLTDNFGEIYSIVHIFGQTEIHDPITSDGNIVQSYDENGLLVYYASENIEYKYDPLIYANAKITVVIGGSSEEYTVTKSGQTLTIKDGDGDDVLNPTYFNARLLNNLVIITMKQEMCDFKTVFGGLVSFSVELTTREDFDVENEVKRFSIYNKIPTTLNLLSKGNATNITEMLNGRTAYAGEVIVKYAPISMEFGYEAWIQFPNGEINAVYDGMELLEDGTYKLIINYLSPISECSKSFEFTIANTEKFIYSVVGEVGDGTYKTVSSTGKGYTYVDAGEEYSVATHYIVNTNYQITLNSNLFPNPERSITREAIDGYTYLYTISNLQESGNDLISGFYTIKFAVSQIPYTNSILTKLEHHGNNIKEGTDDLLSLRTPAITPYITTKSEYENGIEIAWSKYYLLQENTISVEVRYGSVVGPLIYPTVNTTLGGLWGIKLNASGTYYLKFYDKAGNVQMLGYYSDYEYLTVKYLSSVIFEINNETPINYAIYDSAVQLVLPQATIGYYDVNAKPKLFVELDGKPFDEYENKEDGSVIFEQPGFYKVWYTAKIDGKSIYEAPTYFTILSSTESRLRYSYSGYANYYIKDILKAGVSIKDHLFNANNGELIKIDGNPYLKTLSLHASDSKTGSGEYKFIIATNNEFGQEFEFSIWINRAVVPLQMSVANGSTTKDEIVVMFNTKNMISQAGECILKITGFKDFYITQERLDAGEIQEIYSVPITKEGEYYVEVTTLSGQLLYSSFVVKQAPLNTVSIIIIVVVSVVVIVGVVLFILLRRRMKIR